MEPRKGPRNREGKSPKAEEWARLCLKSGTMIVPFFGRIVEGLHFALQVNIRNTILGFFIELG